MKKIIVTFLLFVFLTSIVFARPVKRIKFPKGATKVVVTGNLNGYKDKQVYLLKVRAGQTLKITSPSSVTVYIENPAGEDVSDMDASCNKNKTVEQTEAGDYKITVTECMKADAWKGKFKLNISVK